MDLNTLANIGEFAGAIAVVVSLLYLSVQIRQNSKTVRSASLQAFNDTAVHALSGMAAPGTADIITRGLQDLKSLDPTESFQFTTHISILMIGFQNNYFQYEAGFLPEPVWRRQLGVIRWWAALKGVQQAMRLISPTFDPKFVDLMRLPNASAREAKTDAPSGAA